jgi:hypothetical protein
MSLKEGTKTQKVLETVRLGARIFMEDMMLHIHISKDDRGFIEIEPINGDSCLIEIINLSILAIWALGPIGAHRPSKRTTR